MRKYDVVCPNCGEPSVYVSLNDPKDLYCRDCDKDINVKQTISSAIGWIRYAIDLNETLPSKNKIKIPQDASEVAAGTRAIDL